MEFRIAPLGVLYNGNVDKINNALNHTPGFTIVA